jgi:hypothetical protein
MAASSSEKADEEDEAPRPGSDGQVVAREASGDSGSSGGSGAAADRVVLQAAPPGVRRSGRINHGNS